MIGSLRLYGFFLDLFYSIRKWLLDTQISYFIWTYSSLHCTHNFSFGQSYKCYTLYYTQYYYLYIDHSSPLLLLLPEKGCYLYALRTASQRYDAVHYCVIPIRQYESITVRAEICETSCFTVGIYAQILLILYTNYEIIDSQDLGLNISRIA